MLPRRRKGSLLEIFFFFFSKQTGLGGPGCILQESRTDRRSCHLVTSTLAVMCAVLWSVVLSVGAILIVTLMHLRASRRQVLSCQARGMLLTPGFSPCLTVFDSAWQCYTSSLFYCAGTVWLFYYIALNANFSPLLINS